MSLFLSEWVDGPAQFMDFCDIAYSPTILCRDNPDKPGSVQVFVTIFDLEALNALLEDLDPPIRKNFVSRFDAVSAIVLKKLGLEQFLASSMNLIYAREDYDFEKASLALSELFTMLITEFEFWNRVDIVELYTNLIFYGMVDNPKPFVFVIPPLSQWDESSE